VSARTGPYSDIPTIGTRHTSNVHQMYTVHTLATYTLPNLCVAHLPCSVMPSRARTRGGAAVNGNLAFFRMAKGGRARTCGLPGVESG
jgi:hypothetical protein